MRVSFKSAFVYLASVAVVVNTVAASRSAVPNRLAKRTASDDFVNVVSGFSDDLVDLQQGGLDALIAIGALSAAVQGLGLSGDGTDNQSANDTEPTKRSLVNRDSSGPDLELSQSGLENSVQLAGFQLITGITNATAAVADMSSLIVNFQNALTELGFNLSSVNGDTSGSGDSDNNA